VLFTGAAFFMNHFFSFRINSRADSARTDIGRLMFFPYIRIMPMHLTIILGTFVMLLLRNQFAEYAVLVFFLALKTIADVRMHILEHAQTAVENEKLTVR
jgi:hypothetical protein